MTKIRQLAGAGALALTIALVAVACSSSSSSSTSTARRAGGFEGVGLTGAGATFPDPIYEQWFQDFHQVEPGAKINYQAIGSGGGIEQFTAQTVDFGASDAPLQADEIEALPTAYIELPTVLGGVVIAYNVQGVDSGLKLDGDTAAKIFLGNITKWNDPAIAALNPDVSLPEHADLGRPPVRRVGDHVRVHLMALRREQGLGHEGRRRQGGPVADRHRRRRERRRGRGIGQTDGSIGYLSYDFAVVGEPRDRGHQERRRRLRHALDRLDQQGGRRPHVPDPDRHEHPQLLREGRVPDRDDDLSAPDYKDGTDTNKAQTIFDFVTWALTDGQADGATAQLRTAPVGHRVSRPSGALSTMKVNGSAAHRLRRARHRGDDSTRRRGLPVRRRADAAVARSVDRGVPAARRSWSGCRAGRRSSRCLLGS